MKDPTLKATLYFGPYREPQRLRIFVGFLGVPLTESPCILPIDFWKISKKSNVTIVMLLTRFVYMDHLYTLQLYLLFWKPTVNTIGRSKMLTRVYERITLRSLHMYGTATLTMCFMS